MAYNRNQKHRNQSDTNARNHDSKKKHFKRRKRLTREDYQIPGCATGVKVPEGSYHIPCLSPSASDFLLIRPIL